jgi:hypothetical protein
MISEEVQRRVASYYMENKMTEEQLNELESALVDTIWLSNKLICEDKLVKGWWKTDQVFLEATPNSIISSSMPTDYFSVGILVVILIALSGMIRELPSHTN